MNHMFSIITVVLNDIDGLQVTAKSIASQELNYFEWIVIDGGSDDGSLEVLDNVNTVSPIVFSGKDNGIYDAMNMGINAASGDYIIFMNAGDSFANQFVLENLERNLVSESVDVLLGGTYQHIKNCIFYRPPKNINWIVHGLPAFHQSTVYKTDLLRKQHYNVEFSLLADYEWLAKRCVEGVTVGYLNQPVSNFFVGGSSYTKIWLKFKDSYRVKNLVLQESKIWSLFSAIHAIGKTIFVMSVLYKICGVSNIFGNRRQIKRESDKLTTEYYKHPESSA